MLFRRELRLMLRPVTPAFEPIEFGSDDAVRIVAELVEVLGTAPPTPE